MRIGVPKEIKKGESRVGLVPSSVRELRVHNHQIIVQKGAGEAINFADAIYEKAGALLVDSAADVFQQADLIVKVKEPQPSEYSFLRPGQLIFTYLHLAPDPQQAKALLDSGCIAVAYETVTDIHGRLPLLMPMSEVAGCLAIQAGAYSLEKVRGGRGILLGGVAGVEKGNVVVLGGGTVGTHAIRMAIGHEARVTVLDQSLPRLQELDYQFGAKLNTIFASRGALERCVMKADMVVGAVLTPGHATPKLVSRKLVSKMRPGAVVVDVSVDQGGCFETSRPTTHENPTYIVDGVVHYCVDNMPGAVPRTATFALNNATLPFIIELANKGFERALLENEHLCAGLNIYKGHVTYAAVAHDLELPYTPISKLLQAE